MRPLLLIGRAWKRAKSKNINFRLTFAAQKRIFLSSPMSHLNGTALSQSESSNLFMYIIKGELEIALLGVLNKDIVLYCIYT